MPKLWVFGAYGVVLTVLDTALIMYRNGHLTPSPLCTPTAPHVSTCPYWLKLKFSYFESHPTAEYTEFLFPRNFAFYCLLLPFQSHKTNRYEQVAVRRERGGIYAAALLSPHILSRLCDSPRYSVNNSDSRDLPFCGFWIASITKSYVVIFPVIYFSASSNSGIHQGFSIRLVPKG
jgi:hypothetical protein